MARPVDPELREKRITEILKAAVSLFSEKGFHQTTMQEICTRANISPGALYRYFPGKEDIIQDIARRERDAAEGLLSLFKDCGTFMQALEQACPVIIDYLSDPAVARLSKFLGAENLRDPDFAAEFTATDIAFKQEMIRAVERDQKAGLLTAEISPEHAVILVISIFSGICTNAAYETVPDAGDALSGHVIRMVGGLLGAAAA